MDSSGESLVLGPASAGALRSLGAELTAFLPATARPNIGRPEARDAPRACLCISGECPAASYGLLPPLFYYCPEPFSCTGN